MERSSRRRRESRAKQEPRWSPCSCKELRTELWPEQELNCSPSSRQNLSTTRGCVRLRMRRKHEPTCVPRSCVELRTMRECTRQHPCEHESRRTA